LLKTIEYLNSRNVDELKAELAIDYTVDETGRYFQFNYCQIDSPKRHEVVLECRGLILERLPTGNWKYVGRAFPRFFNLEEFPDVHKNFVWKGSVAQEKFDGSLIILNFRDGEWHCNTRGSFALGHIPAHKDSGITWKSLVLKAFGLDSLEGLKRLLFPEHSYVFELCSPYNKIVRQYDKTFLAFLSVFDHHGRELKFNEYLEIAKTLNLNFRNVVVPQYFYFHEVDKVRDYLRKKEETDPTFEGVVIRDCNDMRVKVKSKTYVALHRLHNNGCGFGDKNLATLAILNEGDEALTYFPEYKPRFAEIKENVDREYSKLMDVWDKYNKIEGQKEFALAVVPATRFSGILFTVRNKGGNAEMVKKLWVDQAEKIGEILTKGK